MDGVTALWMDILQGATWKSIYYQLVMLAKDRFPDF